ncbi:hypothetical protein GW793_03025 [bacterium]|uniref:Heparan-alpha-glucosaminide N-acetyltransferase catalytic domain-containing protein n=2 Tax=Katanobacteria TaxID=422282 RepID=A0A2H0BFK3_UNCKA|nr:hypothetical protein [bacterium]PIP56453.1 MAG: hypothetical protein COX05_03015 [candidate division WWE3 bacterium CG22_combo_CG10-13_8_21_14_all_39_12]
MKPTTMRFESLDMLRGVALMFIILFHSSIYNYANIDKIDFDNPPIVVVLMSFMALWGGIFIIYSTVVMTHMFLKRMPTFSQKMLIKYSLIAGAIYLFFHYILNILLGRWNTDFVNNQPDMTAIASTLRNMHLTFPHITKYFEGSSLSTIALNLILLSFVLYFLLKNNGIQKTKRNYTILTLSGIIIMLLSFVRVLLYPFFTQAMETNNYVLATFYSFTIANPYPLLPYFAYGIFGVLIGMMLVNNHTNLLKKFILPLGILFIAYGIGGMMQFDKTISTPDYFWYFKTNFELGVFILLLISSVLILEPRKKFMKSMSVITWFSRISLTIYMLETATSELMRIALLGIYPNWNQTINGCLLFGALNIILWIVILSVWKRNSFKYSLEYFWVKFFNRVGKQSTKMDLIL